MADYRKLRVWRQAHELNIRVAKTAQRIRGNTYISLRSQMARAAHSIPANIVEGREQKTDRHFASFVRISVSSATELDFHVLTARDLGLLADNDYRAITAEIQSVRRQLYSLLKKLEDTIEPT